jgi:hypothetical protein
MPSGKSICGISQPRRSGFRHHILSQRARPRARHAPFQVHVGLRTTSFFRPPWTEKQASADRRERSGLAKFAIAGAEGDEEVKTYAPQQ